MSYDQNRPDIPTEARRSVMTEAGHKCIVRHCTEHIIEVHHIDENRENNDPSNLAVLCDKHHKLAHQGKISRMDLRKYKELLASTNNSYPATSSAHDRRLLHEINELLNYETITIIQNENFEKFVKSSVIEPFNNLISRSGDPLFKFTDRELEILRADLMEKARIFRDKFVKQSGGRDGGFDYIDLKKIQKTNPEMIEYWEEYAFETARLARDFCNSALKLRAELVNYP